MIYNNHTINKNIWNYLLNLKKKSRVPNAILFHGDEGSGKEACSIEFAALINCNSTANGFACGECQSCNKIINNNHEFLNYIIPLPKGKISSKKDDIAKSFNDKTLAQYNSQFKNKLKDPYYHIKIDGANTILINSIRSIKKQIYSSIDRQQWRTILIWDAEQLCIPNSEAANSILKILEEPPARTVFILVTSKPNLILKTIKSRCLSLFFPNIDKDSFNNTSSIDTNINLYKLLNGNVKMLKRIEPELNGLYSFIKLYNQKIKQKKTDLSMVDISNLSKLDKEIVKIHIELVKHYYIDLARINLDKDSTNLTFPFLNKDYLEINNLYNINWSNALNIINSYDKQISNQSQVLYLINLFNSLGKHLKHN
tara:strand:+ start:3714 stop:4820 length:1107 start_codon:yes stop_codon:yes gene_type:complete